MDLTPQLATANTIISYPRPFNMAGTVVVAKAPRRKRKRRPAASTSTQSYTTSVLAVTGTDSVSPAYDQEHTEDVVRNLGKAQCYTGTQREIASQRVVNHADLGMDDSRY